MVDISKLVVGDASDVMVMIEEHKSYPMHHTT